MKDNDKFNLRRVVGFYYSPTGTTKTVVNAIARGTGLDTRLMIENNLTFPEYADSLVDVMPDDLVIIGGPVYAGRIAPVAMKRLEGVEFAGNPAVLVAVYGNRHYDNALVELHEFALRKGLMPVAAAAFIGEHSYSNDDCEIAMGRPDAADRRGAAGFGAEIFNRFNQINGPVEPVKVPGTRPLPERRAIPPSFAETIEKICVKCGKCQEVCPTGAVYFDKGYKTQKELCTVCCACLKACKRHARVIKSEHIEMIRERLLANASDRREPEIFF